MSKKKVAINGFGRIGKCLARMLISDKDAELVAINSGASKEDVLRQLKYDSVHGKFDLPIPGEIKFTSKRSIEDLDWQGIDVVFECTGNFNDREKASLHLARGASRVIVSAPCDGVDKTIIYGVNHHSLTAEDKIISIGSCTTNCFVPICFAVHKEFGVEKGFMTTIHSYTNDQRILDGSHKDPRRARAAALSMIPTSTGATQIMGEIFPELKGKISGGSIRVPTPNVSVIDFCFQSQKNCTKEELISTLQHYADGRLQGILAVEREPLVSTDFNGRSESSIVDALETNVIDGNFIRILAWYDNEWGFSKRMIDLLKI